MVNKKGSQGDIKLKQINFKKVEAGQLVSGTLRILNRFLYFKYANNTQLKSIIENFRAKGIKVQEGLGWIKVDLIGDNEIFKLGSNEYNINEVTDEEIENILFNFYLEQYKKLNFIVEVKDE